jgi:hypothetical protein
VGKKHYCFGIILKPFQRFAGQKMEVGDYRAEVVAFVDDGKRTGRMRPKQG